MLAATHYEAYVESIKEICAAEPILSALAPSVPITTDLLAHGTVHTGERHAPEEPIRHALAPVHAAERTHLLSPIILPSYVEVIHDRIVESGMHAELLLTTPVINRLTSRYRERFSDTLATGRVTVYEITAPLSFGVFLPGTGSDKSVVLTVSTPHGVQGTLVNDTAAAVAWGEDIYDNYKHEANPLRSPAEP